MPLTHHFIKDRRAIFSSGYNEIFQNSFLIVTAKILILLEDFIHVENLFASNPY
jgi:hypothetical protein